MLRIIKQPFRIQRKHGGRWEWQFKLSDGRTVNLTQLAAIANIHPSQMGRRIAELGWNHPDVLHVGRRPTKGRRRGKYRVPFDSWMGLGDVPRERNLNKMA